MRRRCSSSLARPQAPAVSRTAGFTLVEMLIVITIIALLATLLLAGVNRVRVAGKRTAAAAEISQLDSAVTKFKLDNGFYPPQTFTFPSSATPTKTDEQDGIKLLSRMFRQYTPGQAITFYGNNMAGVTISGSQCLVFFLGGPSGQGFAKTTPTEPTSAGAKLGPYYDFPASRLKVDPSNPNGGPTAVFDTWDTPYMYFSTGVGSTYPTTAISGTGAEGASTVTALYSVVNAKNKYLNAEKVQIISAGPNGLFGSGGLYAPNSGDYTETTGKGSDDFGNLNNGTPLAYPGS